MLKAKLATLPKLEAYPFMESLNVPPSGPTVVEDITDEQERELVLFVLFQHDNDISPVSRGLCGCATTA